MKFIKFKFSNLKKKLHNFIQIEYPSVPTNLTLVGNLNRDALTLENLNISSMNISDLYERNMT